MGRSDIELIGAVTTPDLLASVPQLNSFNTAPRAVLGLGIFMSGASRLIAGPLPGAFVATAPLFLLGYHLTRKRHAQIIADLEQRHARDAAVSD